MRLVGDLLEQGLQVGEELVASGDPEFAAPLVPTGQQPGRGPHPAPGDRVPP
ncbi:hypothetical protein ACFYPC_26230 [Streptomyces sp. NPDC005808]|uniref:hypothetical protein n=1 Tax=Streptomyces sp. NPDC005808 TaxID=3364734 RepID=UPI00368B179E